MRKDEADLALGVARGMLARGVSPDVAARATGVAVRDTEQLATQMAYDSLCDGTGTGHATHGVRGDYAAAAPRTRREAEKIASHAARMKQAKPQTEAELQALIAAAAGRTRIMPTRDVREGAQDQRPRAGRR